MENVLKSQHIGRLGCYDGHHPYVVPITYFYNGDSLICQSQEGKKLSILRKHPKICFQVDIVNSTQNWQSVQVFGDFEELKESDADKAREELFGSVLNLMTTSKSHRFEHESDDKMDDSNRIKQIMFKINIREFAGRFEKQ